MKYIKKFESEFLTLKKYVVWKFPTNLMILETLEYDKDFALFNRLHNYNKGSKIIFNADEQLFTFNKHEIKKRVVFESDNINDCLDIDFLSSVFDMDKFNL